MIGSHYNDYLARLRSKNSRTFDGVTPKDKQSHRSFEKKGTVSTLSKKQAKKQLQPLAPFRAGGGMRNRSEISDRRTSPGLHDNFYDSVMLEERSRNEDSRSRCLYGPFVPTCSRPKWEILDPLSYRRLPATCRIKPRHGASFRRVIHTAPTLGASMSGLDGTSADFDSEDWDWGDCRPATSASSKSMASRRGVSSHEASPRWHSSGPQPLGSSNFFLASDMSVDLLKSAVSDKTEKAVSPKRKSIFGASREHLAGGAHTDEFSAGSPLIFGNASTKEDKHDPASDSDELKVFRRFQDDGTVHIDDLAKILQALGYSHVHEEWITPLLRKISNYSNLALDNYLQFIVAYKRKQQEAHKADFDEIDKDESGSLDREELADLLKSWKISPMSHVLDEVLDEVDEDCTGTVSFDEFEQVVHLLRLRQGFTKSEYREIMGMFHAHDKDKKGFMDTADVRVALDWLGYPVSSGQLEAVIHDVDMDNSGHIDELEWLTGMRKVREKKIAELQEVMRMNDKNHDGNIQYNELTTLLCSLGYFPCDAAVKEAAKNANIHEDDEDLDISELWRFMKVYRDREGLTEDEANEIEEAWVGAGMDPDGEVTVMQIGKIIRSIGYMLCFDRQQDLFAKVDINSSGTLDKREFRKMIRLINQQDIDTIRMAFHETKALKEEHQSESGEESQPGIDLFSGFGLMRSENSKLYRTPIPHDKDFITVDQALTGLERLSCVDSEGKVIRLRARDKVGLNAIDIYGFCEAARRGRVASRASFRKNGGFSMEDIQKMEERFQEFDADGSGELSGHEVVRVLEVHFPTLANSEARRPLILQLLKEADEDGNGCLEFGDFLRLMRQVKDIQDQLMLSKELRAIEETRFSPSEVLEFRELLLAVRGEAAEIGLHEVQMLLGAVVPMGAKNQVQLKEKFDQVAKRQSGVDGSSEMLDFPEFLWLMRDLLDMNFANMAERVKEMQEKGAPRTP